MQDPTKSWTQSKLQELAYSKKERNISKTLDFVDSMMRLREMVFTAQSRHKSIHLLALSKEPMNYERYSYYEDLRREFWHACSWVLEACLIDYPKKIDKLSLSQVQKRKLAAKLIAANKFVQQIRNDPKNDNDSKRIIHRHSDWKWSKI